MGSTIYVDTRIPSDGTGSRINPRNTLVGLGNGDGDTVMLACGATFPAASVGNLFNPAAVTVGEYGTGGLPWIDGATVYLPSAWFYLGAGIYSVLLSGNIVGNVCRNELPMTFAAWSAAWDTADKLAAALPVDGFTFDYVNFVLYIRPKGGKVADSLFQVSTSNYGVRSIQTRVGLNLWNLGVRRTTTHAVSLMNRINMKARGLRMEVIGGARNTSTDVHLGNGIELGPGCFDCEVWDCEAFDIFDSAYTSQTFGTFGAKLSDHRWHHLRADRCGLAGVEIAAVDQGGLIHSIWVHDVRLKGMGVGNWSGNRSGVGFSTYNHTDLCRIDNVHYRDIYAEDLLKLWTSGGTAGTNSAQDCYAVNAVEYLASSNRRVNFGRPGYAQRDLWKNVRDDKDRTPTNDPASGAQDGSVNGRFIEVAGISWPRAFMS